MPSEIGAAGVHCVCQEVPRITVDVTIDYVPLPLLRLKLFSIVLTKSELDPTRAVVSGQQDVSLQIPVALDAARWQSKQYRV